MKRFFALALALALALSAAACGGGNGGNNSDPGSQAGTSQNVPGDPAAEPQYKEEVVIALRMQVTTLDPQALTNTVQNQVLKLFHGTLVDLDTVTNEIKPDLADSWNWVDDKTIEFTLNANAKFHNGEPVTAQDVLFTMERGKDGVASKSRVGLFEKVEAVDEKTVRLTLKSPNQDLLDTLSLPVCSILSEKAFADDPEEGYKIGAGVWVLDEFVTNDYMAFHRFDDYHRELTPTKKLKVRYIPEDSARAIALQTGEIDLCDNVVPIDIAALEDDPNVDVITYDSPNCQYFAFNYQNKQSPVNNKLVRHAIAHAIKRDEIIMACKDGYGVPGKTFWGSNQYGYYDGFEGYDYDPEKAKALLTEAGYPNGLELTITCVSGERVVSAEVIQAQLKEIGVTLNINEVDTAGMTSAVTSGDFECCLYGIGFNSAGDDVRRIYYTTGSNNRSWYTNEEVDRLIDEAVGESDDAKRKDLYRQIQEIAAEDLPVICLYYENGIVGCAKGLGGIQWGCSSANDMSGVYVQVA